MFLTVIGYSYAANPFFGNLKVLEVGNFIMQANTKMKPDIYMKTFETILFKPVLHFHSS